MAPRAGRDAVRATDGRVPGRRAIATRQRLLGCTRELLSKRACRDIKVIDIARKAGTSPASFERLRARALVDITDALPEAIGDQQRRGRRGPEVDATAEAFVLIAMLARRAPHRHGFELWGERTGAQVETIARILYDSIAVERVPASVHGH